MFVCHAITMLFIIACACVCLCVMLSQCCSYTANSIVVHSRPCSGTYSASTVVQVPLVMVQFAFGVLCCILLLLLLLLLFTCIYNYIPETNQVFRVYSVAFVLHLQFMLHVQLYCPWNMFCTSTSALSAVCVQHLLPDTFLCHYYYYYYYYY